MVMQSKLALSKQKLLDNYKLYSTTVDINLPDLQAP